MDSADADTDSAGATDSADLADSADLTDSMDSADLGIRRIQWIRRIA